MPTIKKWWRRLFKPSGLFTLGDSIEIRLDGETGWFLIVGMRFAAREGGIIIKSLDIVEDTREGANAND